MLLFSDLLWRHQYCGHGNKRGHRWKKQVHRLWLFSPSRFLINKIILIWACVEPFNCLVWFVWKCISPFLPPRPSFVLSFHAFLIVRFYKMWKIYCNIIQKLHKKYLWKTPWLWNQGSGGDHFTHHGSLCFNVQFFICNYSYISATIHLKEKKICSSASAFSIVCQT